MGTIVARKRKDRSTGFTAQIVIKRGGRVVHREAKTFDRRQAAALWMEKREKALREPDGLARAKVPNATLAEAIDHYIADTQRDIGRTKAQVLRSIKEYGIASMKCEDIASHDIVAFATELGKGRAPQTVQNYLSHLSAIFAVAKPAWGYPLDREAMKDALTVTRRLGMTTKSRERSRRPTLDELDKLLVHFTAQSVRWPDAVPMHRIMRFALFSTRRLEEITRITRKDYDKAGKRVLVRDMKNPGEKKGNDVWCDLPDAALAFIDPAAEGRLFPYNPKSVSTYFTRACKLVGIGDLHFHDLRHEGVSRLFEMGWTIPHVAAVSGHRSWQSLQRYTHLRQTGDKYEDWKWLAVVMA